MTTFLDVGAHDGQTLEEVLKPTYRFDRICAFEPMPAQFRNLVERFAGTDRLQLLNYGLADSTGPRDVYGTNEGMEASVFQGKADLVDSDHVTKCWFVGATQWFRSNIVDGETVIVKLNCEGSEVIILDDLARSGAVHQIAEVLIDFDIRKVPGQEWREPFSVQHLVDAGFSRYSLSERVMQGDTHQERIANWLSGVSSLWRCSQ